MSAKPWVKFKLRCRHIDTDGQASERNVVITARSEKEAINRWLWKQCANDMAKRNRYHLWIPNTQLQLGLTTKEEV